MLVDDEFKYDRIRKTKWGYLVVDNNMNATQIHEVLEEIYEVERWLGCELMLQRDREGRLP